MTLIRCPRHYCTSKRLRELGSLDLWQRQFQARMVRHWCQPGVSLADLFRKSSPQSSNSIEPEILIVRWRGQEGNYDVAQGGAPHGWCSFAFFLLSIKLATGTALK